MNTHQQSSDNSPDLWANDNNEHTDDFAADPADILEARELRDGVNLLGRPIDNATH